VDENVREAYKTFQESKGPLNQIRIRTEGDDLVDLGEVSKIVKAIRTIPVLPPLLRRWGPRSPGIY
jgi:hypothetical protein